MTRQQTLSTTIGGDTSTPTAPARGTNTATVKINATGRWVLDEHLDDTDPAKKRIMNTRIMDPVELSHRELERVHSTAETVDVNDVHWLNTKMRIRRALQETTE